MRTGFDQRPWCHRAADPLRPMAVHDEADAQDTDRARIAPKSGTERGADQRCPSKTVELPEAPMAKQNAAVGHDTDSNPFATTFRLGDHRPLSKVSVCPSRFTATQAVAVGHDTSMSRSLIAPVDGGWNEAHVAPSKVATVLDPPAVPFAPTVAQNV